MSFPFIKTLVALMLPAATYAQVISPIAARIIQINIPVETIIGRASSTNDSSSANVTHTSTEPIRRSGTICAPTTLKRGNEPLIILDGKATPYRNIRNSNPNDIESILVIKGEEAISRYGRTGENGVLIITSKRTVVKNKKGPLN